MTRDPSVPLDCQGVATLAMTASIKACISSYSRRSSSSFVASKPLDPLHSRKGKVVTCSVAPVLLPSLKGPLGSCLKAGADVRVWAMCSCILVRLRHRLHYIGTAPSIYLIRVVSLSEETHRLATLIRV
ncbi:hypothetical protein RHGRI_001196 [Rhododendron griersonianum]|uniref:Uncharacterized protein n=1 Tax=Rhododendron griersonianum TaxID=479676 RepID=A0AAV6LKD4_9ERIC|nr:hypothetical protein RHGRI_001196 [Rhododendron griersonianum]